MSGPFRVQAPFRHEAMAYSGRAQFGACAATLLSDALDREERAFVVCAGALLDDVRERLGSDAAAVTFVDDDVHRRNPGRLIALLDGFRAAGSSASFVVSDLRLSRTPPSAADETVFCEALLNDRSLSLWPMTVICLVAAEARADRSPPDVVRRPSPIAATDDDLVEPGWVDATHPVVRGRSVNSRYEPQLAEDLFVSPLPAPPPGARCWSVTSAGLTDTRVAIRQWVGELGLAADKIDDLVLAVNEIVTNSLQHGGGRARVCLWHDETSAVCEVDDAGILIDPLVGRFYPDTVVRSGRGIWLANHLVDLLQLRSTPGGTQVRLHVLR